MFTQEEIDQIEKNLADGFPPFDEPIPYEEMDYETRDEYDYYQRRFDPHYDNGMTFLYRNDWRD